MAGRDSPARGTQRAARLHGPRDLRIAEIPYPGDPAPGEARVRIAAVGVCGSDLHSYLDGRIGQTTIDHPTVLGHEFAGVVEAVGDGALDGTGRELRVGTRVAVDPARPCGRCELCQRGHPNLCTDLDFAGHYPVEGALQEWLVTPAACCFPVGESIELAEGAMLEPLGIALHAVDLAHIKPGDTVAIVGSGSIGLCCLQVARLAGAATVFSTDRHTWRLEAAMALGAEAVDVDAVDPVRAIMEATGGRGVDVALECAWSDEEAIGQGVDVLRNGGRLVVVGIAGDDRLVFNHSAVRHRGLTIAISRRMKHTYLRAIELVETGRVDVARLVTDHFDLSEAPVAFEEAAGYRRGLIKAVLHP